MLFYITFIEFKAFFAQGVHRKIQGQVSSMERELGKIFYTGWSYPKAVLMREGEVIETEPAVKGNTTNNAMKDATIETGYVVKVPLFINQGEKIIISTSDGKYSGRA